MRTNEELLEKLYLHQIYNTSALNEEVYERSLYGGPLQFIKDSAKTLLQIKRLEPNDEIVLDLISPTGFLSILKNEKDYTLTLVIKGQHSREFHLEKATDVMKRLVSLLKDQMTTGRKELKAKYGK